jgi:dihydroneopterin aldolase
MLDVLKIKNMVFYAYHGLRSEEKLKGQQFEVDVEARLDLHPSGASDCGDDTVDINLLYDIVEEVVLEGDFNLLEAIAEHIAEALLNKLKMEEVLVRVRKPNSPIRGIASGIEVEIVRKA